MKTGIIVVVCLLLGACAVGQNENDGDGDFADVRMSVEATSTKGCPYTCDKCKPGDLCEMICVAHGTCTNTDKNACVDFMMCMDGYRWDSKACRCAPDPNHGQPANCGPSLHCGGNETCCSGPGPISIDGPGSWFCEDGKNAPCPL